MEKPGMSTYLVLAGKYSPVIRALSRHLFQGGSMELSGGVRSSGRRPRVEARSAEWGRGLGKGYFPPQYGGPGVLTPGKF